MQRSTPMRKYLLIFSGIAAGIAIVIQIVSLTLANAASVNVVATAGDWTTYVSGQQRTGFNSAETSISTGNIHSLVLKWSQFAGKGVSDQPIEVGGVVFWGSWDGYFHAFTTSGQHIWDRQIGTTTDSSCDPVETGVASSAAFGTIGSTPAIFVSGGNASFYALNANTGAIIWSTSLGSSPSHFLWSSPLLANGSVYIGESSYGDCPLVEGQVMKLDAATGALQNTFNVVPNGCLGAGVWSSPTLDPTGSTLFVTTGNAASCGKVATPYGSALVQLNASDLSVVNSWQVPKGQQTGDGDFGATPTVFDTNGKHYIGVANKNGLYYLFNRDNIANGPIFETQIATDVGDCPQCGDGSIVPGAWDGSLLYVAGGRTTVGTTACKGSVQAINPSTLTVVWKLCMQSGVVLGPLTVANGVVIATQGQDLNFIKAATGAGINYFHDGRAGALFYGGASVSHGQVFVGNMDGYLYAYGLSLSPTPTPTPTPPPGGFSNIGISNDTATTTASYDGGGNSYSAQALSADGINPGGAVTTNGFTFTWPNVAAGTYDNYLASGQTLAVTPVSQADHLGILGAAANGAASGTATITYTDNTTQTFTLGFTDWATSTLSFGNSTAATMSYRNTPRGTQALTVHLFVASVALQTSKTIKSVTLPTSITGGQLHVFAVGTNSTTAAVYNNVGITNNSNVAVGNYDGGGNSYSAQALQTAGLTAGGSAKTGSNNITFTWPNVAAGSPENYQSTGQVIPVNPASSGSVLGFLGSATNGVASGTVTVTYTDSSTSTFTLTLSDWTLNGSTVQPASGNTTAYSLTYRNDPHATNGQQAVKTYIFYTSAPLTVGKTIKSVTLPATVTGGQLHIFAIATN
jgi:hypothetical protein